MLQCKDYTGNSQGRRVIFREIQALLAAHTLGIYSVTLLLVISPLLSITPGLLDSLITAKFHVILTFVKQITCQVQGVPSFV